ncbi:MAG: hypothetical protein RG741_10370, partial [Bacteroidales bacterium]|nr:hypothetical protein [Bacteroidales bacterium]
TLVGISLSKPPEPDREVVLNTGFRRGDSSIRLIEGERLVFTADVYKRQGLCGQCRGHEAGERIVCLI